MANNIKIIIFYKHFLSDGGMPRETLLMAKALSNYSQVEVYCLSPDRFGYTRRSIVDGIVTKIFGVSKILYRSKWSLLIPRSLFESLYNSSPDVVILVGSFISEHFALYRFFRLHNIPYILSIGEALNPNTFIGFKGLKKMLWLRFFEKAIIQNALALRIYSEVQKEHLLRLGIKVTYITLKEGVDLEKVPKHYINAPNYGVLLDPPVFGFLGRLDLYKKGLDLLLISFKKYKAMGGRGILKIVGPSVGNSKSLVQNIINKLKINDVFLMDEISGYEKYKFLKSISCLIVPSRHEGIPRVTREALIVGCPIMVTENTNMHDIVNKYNCGMVISTNPDDICEKLLNFEKKNSESRSKMSINALKAGKDISWDHIASSFVTEIKKLLNLK